MNRAQRVDRMKQLRAMVPRIDCKGLCHDSCGPIGMTPMEKARLDAAAGHDVKTTPTLTCTALDDNKRCSAYEERPLICRLWGVAEGMACGYGCQIIDNNGKPLTAVKAAAMIQEMERLSPGKPYWTADPLAIQMMHKAAGIDLPDEVYRD